MLSFSLQLKKNRIPATCLISNKSVFFCFCFFYHDLKYLHNNYGAIIWLIWFFWGGEGEVSQSFVNNLKYFQGLLAVERWTKYKKKKERKKNPLEADVKNLEGLHESGLLIILESKRLWQGQRENVVWSGMCDSSRTPRVWPRTISTCLEWKPRGEIKHWQEYLQE